MLLAGHRNATRSTLDALRIEELHHQGVRDCAFAVRPRADQSVDVALLNTRPDVAGEADLAADVAASQQAACRRRLHADDAHAASPGPYWRCRLRAGLRPRRHRSRYVRKPRRVQGRPRALREGSGGNRDVEVVVSQQSLRRLEREWAADLPLQLPDLQIHVLEHCLAVREHGLYLLQALRAPNARAHASAAPARLCQDVEARADLAPVLLAACQAHPMLALCAQAQEQASHVQLPSFQGQVQRRVPICIRQPKATAVFHGARGAEVLVDGADGFDGACGGRAMQGRPALPILCTQHRGLDPTAVHEAREEPGTATVRELWPQAGSVAWP
mmetsp:Transcript_79657/g.257570  ORF Transcript_79657/g.257570 Transcript_79657/m.257570 type:complete len:330 (+) Transcript_79657:1470-2459(+)